MLDTITDNYKFLIAEANFIKTRAQHLDQAFKTFEADIGYGCLILDIFEKVSAELFEQRNLAGDSMEEIFESMTEKFTSEEKNSQKKVREAPPKRT